jgi:hypothetical protein
MIYKIYGMELNSSTNSLKDLRFTYAYTFSNSAMSALFLFSNSSFHFTII